MGIYDFKVKDMNDSDVSLSDYKGKVLLIVNTATHCGFTPQFPGLQALYAKYKDRGFEILDFPCNQFMGQAPEGIEEYHNICTTRFGVTFRQFAKIEVNGKNESPLYTYLKEKTGGKNIGWNFTKFLIDKEGNIVKRFESKVKPEEIDPEIAALLK
jgi:glutathione peroxidase